jgi:hypothetical protein
MGGAIGFLLAMTNERSPQSRLSRFSKADRVAPDQRQKAAGAPESAREPEGAAPEAGLSRLLEEYIGKGHPAEEAPAAGPGNDVGVRKLLDELQAARDRVENAPEAAPAFADEERGATDGAPGNPAASPSQTVRLRFLRELRARSRQSLSLLKTRSPRTLFSGQTARRLARSFYQGAIRAAVAMRPAEWRRRHLVLITLAHWHVFDRRVERLLFNKTPPPLKSRTEEVAQAPRQAFIYEGPFPRLALQWAISALPADLRRFAFIDFQAGNGRVLLIASAWSFEYAAGYAFSAQSHQDLELNIAQYPRSYMRCRDVRALRGDLEGVAIPAQPAVLFIPDALRGRRLEIAIDHLSASWRLNPRPLYLIFENSRRKWRFTVRSRVTPALRNRRRRSYRSERVASVDSAFPTRLESEVLPSVAMSQTRTWPLADAL